MPRHPLSTTVKFKPLHDDVQLPKRQSAEAAGFDLHAYLPDGKVGISPGERKVVPTGFSMQLDPGYEGQVRPRSGLAIKEGVTVINAPGTIDSDYRGEVKVGLVNMGNTTFIVEPGARIAQLVVAAVARVSVVELEVQDELEESERGEGGLGSTGVV
jgi:dUTP pyrophosphatase